MSFKDRFCSWVAWWLPRRIAYWAAIRVCARATVKEYSATEVCRLRVMEALDRWKV